MSIIHLVCVTSSGGLPILNRKLGDTDTLPFSTVGSLNGVHMFCKSHDVRLKTTHLPDDGLVVWREFEQCVTLIVSAQNVAEGVIEDLTQLVFGALVLSIGLDALRAIQNANQFKRELKSIYPIVDSLLASVNEDLLRFSECTLSVDGENHLERLNEFSERIGSPFCCLLVQDKIVAGTEGWWDLNPVDRKLLVLTLRTIDVQLKNPADRPVYLPHKSPTVAFRFCVVTIWQNVRVCAVCGAEPRFEEIERLVQMTWSRSDQGLLDAVEQSWQSNIPETIAFSPDILGFILLNRLTSKYVISQNLHHSVHQQGISSANRSSSVIPGGHRFDILRTFFHQSVDAKTIGLTLRAEDRNANGRWLNQNTNETYWSSEYHKCHSYAFEEYAICMLYMSAIPTHIMRIITQRTLNSILSEKGLLW